MRNIQNKPPYLNPAISPQNNSSKSPALSQNHQTQRQNLSNTRRMSPLGMSQHKFLHPTTRTPGLISPMKSNPARLNSWLQPLLQLLTLVKIHPHKVHIVQALIVMIPSLFIDAWIFVVGCQTENYYESMMVILKDFVKFFNRCDGVDFVSFESVARCWGGGGS